MSDRLPFLRLASAAVLLLALLAGCASTGQTRRPDPRDPVEGFNRSMYKFNSAIDRAVLRPVAVAYHDHVPRFMQTGLSNFLDNLSYPTTMVNDFLQGKFVAGLQDTGRILLNSTLGLGGLLDPASAAGLEKNDEDFGQTFGRWGVPPGPYLVLPLFGPSTVRDAGGLAADAIMTPTWYFVDAWITVSGRLGDAVNARSLVLKEVADSRAAALDWYTSVRHAYLQHREALVHDTTETTGETNDNLYFPDEAAPK